MEAIRKIVRREGNTLTIELPADFSAQTVELIILPADDMEIDPTKNSPLDDKESGLTDFQRFLLSAPDMTDDEYAYILNKREALNQWRKLV